jgi:hypothetical protein
MVLVEVHYASIGPTGEKVGPTTRLDSWSVLTLSSHGLLFTEKVMWQTYLVYLTSGRSLKLKNMQKQENLPCRVKAKIKVIV